MAKKQKVIYFCDKDETHIVEKPTDLIPVKIGDFRGEYCKTCTDACKPAAKPTTEPENPIVPGAE